MRELSSAEVDAIAGGYSQMPMLQARGASAVPAYAAPAPMQTLAPPPQRAAQSPAIGPVPKLEPLPTASPIAQATASRPAPNLFADPNLAADSKIYNVSFTGQNGQPVSKDVSQKEYDMLAEELRKYGVLFKASLL